jgi:diguanylate cyclase (GGDEF)-like protein
MPIPQDDLETLARLRGLFHVTRAVRNEAQLDDVLSAVAHMIAESLGYRTVVVNLFRPAWDDFVVATVHGDERAREELLGSAGGWDTWEPLLDERFRRNGVFLVPAGEYDWTADMLSFTPDIAASDDPAAWHPDDALFVPLESADGELLGIISVDEPLSGRKPADGELEVLAGVAAHAAYALQSAQEAAADARHHAGLGELLAVSSRLTESRSIDVLLAGVGAAIHRALGFTKVSVDLVDPLDGLLKVRHATGWRIEALQAGPPMSVETVQRLLAPEFRQEGCYLLDRDSALERLAADRQVHPSERNGAGPRAWNRHWLLVPLTDRHGRLSGVIWVDDPHDRLLPSRETLQALRVFANQATAAIDAANDFEEVRYLAEHDSLTRLLNRRSFTGRLAGETARSGRYHRPFALVLCDLDGFKQLNDHHGHEAGDAALALFGRLLDGAIRRSDLAFRIGGDEFALLLPETNEANVRSVVKRISGGFNGSDEAVLRGLRASFGVAVFPRDGDDSEKIFRAADLAMYSAKRCGEQLHFAA